jgi:hypothetical protein
VILSSKGNAKENLILLIVFVALIACGFYFKTVKAKAKEDARVGISKNIAVVAAARDLPAGKILVLEDFISKQVSESQPPAIAYSKEEIAALAGSYAAMVDIAQGSQITKNALVPFALAPVSGKLKPNEAAYVIYYDGPVDDLAPGDSVALIDYEHFETPLPALVNGVNGKDITLIIDKAVLDYVIILNNTESFVIRKEIK